MINSLLSVFPTIQDLTSVEPEDLGAVIIEIAPSLMQNGMFNVHSLLAQVYQQVGPSYPKGTKAQASLRIAEALSWLTSQGLIVIDPEQQYGPPYYRLTRRAASLRTRVDVEAFVRGRILPGDLVSNDFAVKVLPLFRRGDYDIAVFQAFKEVEVATRKAANAKGAGYPDDCVGRDLVQKAFNAENGPLTNSELTPGQRQAEMFLFSGAMGHARNPAGHTDVEVTAVEAARLIIFASYLLSIVLQRGS
jgi:hypothetical protein